MSLCYSLKLFYDHYEMVLKHKYGRESVLRGFLLFSFLLTGIVAGAMP